MGFFGGAAAQLVFELVDREGRAVPATFVNLIEAPEDERVVVIARLSHASADVGAALVDELLGSPNRSAPADQ